jgi:hypothetical protein
VRSPDAPADDMKRHRGTARSMRPTGRRTSALRKKCLPQLQEATESEKEELRHELVAEGCPIALTTARSSTPRWTTR